jgi:hypothetical protein
MMIDRFLRATSALVLLGALACGDTADTPDQAAPAAEGAASAPARETAASAPVADDLPNGLLLALSTFEKGEDGKPLPLSELMVLTRSGGAWHARSYDDPESNVFHKALVWAPGGQEPGVATLGGSAAAVKLWRKGDTGLAPVSTLWQVDFGGKWSRMRDAEVGDLDGDGQDELAIATHDQGVVAILDVGADGEPAVTELDRKPETFVHEIELGDLDGDGQLEIYATPSEPNRLDGTVQRGEVVRYVPGVPDSRAVVADLGDRHAKEILVDDVDGDGRDELYVSVEAAEGGAVEVRRFDADTDPTKGTSVGSLYDPMARFLTVGDVDGDGRKEMVVAAKDSGLHLLRPGDDPRSPWRAELIDRDSKGFEHAALLTDLDGDGLDELYVASDDDREVRRYAWDGSKLAREVIHSRTSPLPVLTWNLAPVPRTLVE